jgi:two-component system response regulator HydG
MQLKNASILVIDDDADVLTSLKLLLKKLAKDVQTERNPEKIPNLLAHSNFDLILLDMNFRSTVNTGNEGFYWLNKIKALKSGAEVMMITAYGDIDLAVRALKEGAIDFVVKPWHNDKLIDAIKDAFGRKGKPNSDKGVLKDSIPGSALIGESAAMHDIFHKVKKIAPTDANILVLGENGTGKDLIAKAIHANSLRSHKPFVKVDVGSLTDGLFESELFGHRKGAFTDAREDRTGRFELANGGTLFLDEIGNISLHQQSKLLTVLQNRQVTPLGSNDLNPIDIRLICATNVPLRELANETRFRRDLIYRINTVEITVPPLRDRGDDIMLLAKYFSEIYAGKYLKNLSGFDKKAIDKLVKYRFPGNIRELQYTIERAVIMADGNILQAEDFIFSAIESETQVLSESNLGVLERGAILRVIEKNDGNITKAAKELGITRTALYRRLSKYDI